MSTDPVPPVMEYGRPGSRRVSWWAAASPLVAVGAFVVASFLGNYLVMKGQMTLAYMMLLLCPLGAIGFSVHALRDVRRGRGHLLGHTSAGLAICFSVCSGLLCPGFAESIERSRHMSNTTRTQAAMLQIVQACQAYAGANGDHFPPHLAVLLTGGQITPEQLIDLNAAVTLRPYPESKLVPVGQWATIAADVDAHSDFTYVGGDLDWDYADIIVLYTKPGGVHKHMKFPEETWDGQGRVLGFSDGHTELVLDGDLAAAFAKSNAARAKMGLGAVRLDGPVPVAGKK